LPQQEEEDIVTAIVQGKMEIKKNGLKKPTGILFELNLLK
jgi:hypothetical protein